MAELQRYNVTVRARVNFEEGPEVTEGLYDIHVAAQSPEDAQEVAQGIAEFEFDVQPHNPTDHGDWLGDDDEEGEEA